MLALPAAVPGRRIVVTDARVPGRPQRGAGVCVLDHVEQIPQPGAAEAELRDFDPGAAKFTAGERVHGLSSRLACMGTRYRGPELHPTANPWPFTLRPNPAQACVRVTGRASLLYVDTCSSTALRWRMPNPRIRIAGSSAPGPMIQMNQPRWSGPQFVERTEQGDAAPCPEMPQPIRPGEGDRADARRIRHSRVIIQIEQIQPRPHPADRVEHGDDSQAGIQINHDPGRREQQQPRSTARRAARSARRARS